MNKLSKLFLFFCLISSSAYSEEFIMNCGNSIFKLESGFFSKNLFIRSGAKWNEFCGKSNNEFNHFGDGAECITNHKEFDKTKPIFKNDKWTYEIIKYKTSIKLDFVLKTYNQTYKDRKSLNIKCKDF